MVKENKANDDLNFIFLTVCVETENEMQDS